MALDGTTGWDQYAPFYDWENARTLGRRDVGFWERIARPAARRTILELGCGTGRISIPLAKAGRSVVGIDRSPSMIGRAAERAARLKRQSKGRQRGRVQLVLGDIRELPFETEGFPMVLAPYGILQSLLRDRDLDATLRSVARVLEPGGLFGLDLVPDVPRWREYHDRVKMRGRLRGGATLTLVESVRQDPRRRLTFFDQTYIERRNGQSTSHRFQLTFRTLPVKSMSRRLARAGFAIEATLGDYNGRPWDDRADVWILIARKQA